MKNRVQIIKYKDSAISSDQTDEICKIFEMTAVGFVINEDIDQIVIAQELMENGDFRAQLAIPKWSIVDVIELDQ